MDRPVWRFLAEAGAQRAAVDRQGARDLAEAPGIEDHVGVAEDDDVAGTEQRARVGRLRLACMLDADSLISNPRDVRSSTSGERDRRAVVDDYDLDRGAPLEHLVARAIPARHAGSVHVRHAGITTDTELLIRPQCIVVEPAKHKRRIPWSPSRRRLG